MGVFCWCCGLAHEVWPLIEEGEFIRKYHDPNEPEFRSQVDAARAAVSQTQKAMSETGAQASECGLRITVRAAFVQVLDFVEFYVASDTAVLHRSCDQDPRP